MQKLESILYMQETVRKDSHLRAKTGNWDMRLDKGAGKSLMGSLGPGVSDVSEQQNHTANASFKKQRAWLRHK